jgi:IclR family transcriptional regulator, KDG regulon repressor
VSERLIRAPSPSVARAVKVLEALAVEPDTLSELSRKLEIPKSSLHSIVTTLAEQGWLEDENGLLVLGQKLFQTGVLYGRNRGLVVAFRDIARRAVRQTGETTWLGLLIGRDVLHLARIDGTQPLRYVAEEGERLPAHTTALGKIVLAEKELAELREVFGQDNLPALTPHSITNLSELEEHLHEVREQGYALDKGEVDEDLHCVAAPVRDATGGVVAGVSIAGPAARFSEYLPTYTTIILDTAHAISHRLGYEAAEHGPQSLPGKRSKEAN